MAALMAWLPIFITLVEVHGVDGQRYFVNPAEITTLREPLVSDMRHFAKGARCIVFTVNGRFLAVRETCDQVKDLVAPAP